MFRVVKGILEVGVGRQHGFIHGTGDFLALGLKAGNSTFDELTLSIGEGPRIRKIRDGHDTIDRGTRGGAKGQTKPTENSRLTYNVGRTSVVCGGGTEILEIRRPHARFYTALIQW